MSQLTRIAGSFAIVAIAYWLYALLVVPWIEPPAEAPRQREITTRDRGDDEWVDMRLKELQGLFPPGTLKPQKTMMLESNRAKLIFEDYTSSPDGRAINIHPCIIVFPYAGSAKDYAERLRQSIILEASDGAVLQFDQPLDLTRGRIGRLVAGELKNQVRIRSDWKDPGPEDDLLIMTSGVQLSEGSVSTPNPVDFRWGPHFGRGHEMVIRLLPGQPQPGMEGTGPNVGGVESFELRHVDRLHLDLGQATATPGKRPESTPVDINCHGPFRFDAVNRVATFSDRVDVTMPNPSGPPDQLVGDLLSLYFSQAQKGKPAPGAAKADPKTAGSLDLVAERIEARGKPVRVTAPSKNVVALGERLQYDLQAHSISLDGGREVSLQQGPNEIHAPSLYYQSAEPGHMGKVAAQGPGWLRGQSPDRPDQQLEAVWRDKLRIDPAEGNQQVISLTGGAELRFPGVGQLQSREIYFWLLEMPPVMNGPQPPPRPHRMLARNDVRINAPQLSGKVDELQVWFDESSGNEQRSATATAGTGMGGSPPIVPAGQPSLAQAAQRFEVVGQLLRARVRLGTSQAVVSNLSLEGPAVRFQGGGLNVTGSNINFKRDDNRLWIDGPGQMDVPLGSALQGQALPAGGVLKIDWQRGMNFDGMKVQFDGAVVASTGQQLLHTETMKALMHRPVRFSDQDVQEPKVETIECPGEVLMESRIQEGRQLVAYERMHVTDLAVNVLSGALTAGGPGWLNSVRIGSGDLLAGALPAAPGAAPARAAPTGDKLYCLKVQFQKAITGNVLHRQLTFRDQVQSAYAPVANWDAMLSTDDPDQLGPEGMLVRCDQLSVAEMLPPVGSRQAMILLEALGNTTVDGVDFRARGQSIKYDQSKDLLILEGGGRSNAELSQQVAPGAPRSETSAQRFLYHPKSHWWKVDGMQSLQMSQPPPAIKTR